MDYFGSLSCLNYHLGVCYQVVNYKISILLYSYIDEIYDLLDLEIYHIMTVVISYMVLTIY